MVVIYPVIFTATHDKKNTYLVYIPDIEGMTEGYGLEDAYAMARDYMGCHFLDISDESLPKASEIKDVDVSMSEFASEGDSFVTLIDLDLTAYRRRMNRKTVRRNVSIPEWLNKAAEDAHINVSRVLKEALMEKLGVTE